MTVIVTAVFTPIPGRKDDLVGAMARGIAAVHEEPGCELYAIHDAEDGTVTMIEKWRSVDELEHHGEGDAVRMLTEDVAGLLAEPVRVTRMLPLPVGSAAQGAL